MAVATDTKYIEGLKALKTKEFERALDCFKLTEKEFAENRELRILIESVEMILAVKNELSILSVKENK